MKVHDRDDGDRVAFDKEENGKRKSGQQGPPDVPGDDRNCSGRRSMRSSTRRSPVRKAEPSPSVSRSYHEAASNASTSASGRTRSSLIGL
jgi:hypothetical protein